MVRSHADFWTILGLLDNLYAYHPNSYSLIVLIITVRYGQARSIGVGCKNLVGCNVTRHPTSLWITQQRCEAFPYDNGHRYLIHDRDAKFGDAVGEAISAIGLAAARTSFRSCRSPKLESALDFNSFHRAGFPEGLL